MVHVVLVENYSLMFRKLSVFCVKLLWLVRNLGLYRLYNLNNLPRKFVDIDYAIPESTLFICCTLFSIYFMRFSTFKILTEFYFTISSFCDTGFTS